MQLLPVALAIVLLTLIAGNKDRHNQQPPVVEVEKEAPKKTVNHFSGDAFSVWYSRFETIVN
jgi:hypothetical protein